MTDSKASMTLMEKVAGRSHTRNQQTRSTLPPVSSNKQSDLTQSNPNGKSTPKNYNAYRGLNNASHCSMDNNNKNDFQRKIQDGSPKTLSQHRSNSLAERNVNDGNGKSSMEKQNIVPRRKNNDVITNHASETIKADLQLPLRSSPSPTLIPHAASSRMKPEFMTAGNNVSNPSRPESRCSQHSTASGASRTTTSRRGGRPPRTRSPLSFANTTRRSGSLSPPPMHPQHISSGQNPIPSSNSNKNQSFTMSLLKTEEGAVADQSNDANSKITETKSSVDKSCNEVVQNEKKQTQGSLKSLSPMEARTHHSVPLPSKAPSSVAKKAAAEAQRWFHARESETYSRNYQGYHNSADPYYQHPPYYPGGRGFGGPDSMEGDGRKFGKDGHFPRHDRQNVFRKAPPHLSVKNDQNQRISTLTKRRVSKPAPTNGATTHVMGSLTPMNGSSKPMPNYDHLMKDEGGVTSPRNDSSSIFRYDELSAPPGSPQRMLLDMKCGSKSFELRSPLPSPSSSTFKSGPPLSPQEPPQIQHAHQQINTNSLFFDLQKTPRTPKTPKSPGQNNTIFGTPSFNLFNQDFDSFDENENLNLPTPNQNSKLSLLDSDIRSPTLSLVRSVYDGSPRKASLMNSPYLEGIDHAFSPRMGKRDEPNEKVVNERSMDGAPPMPHVIVNEKSEEEKRKPAPLEFKSETHHPLKKRILEQEKRSPIRSFPPRMNPMTDVRKNIPIEKNHFPPQRRKPLKHPSERRPPYGHQMPRYRPMPPPPANSLPQHPYYPKHPPPKMPKMRAAAAPSLSGMKAKQFYRILASHKEVFERFSFLLPGLSLKSMVDVLSHPCSNEKIKLDNESVAKANKESTNKVKTEAEKLNDMQPSKLEVAKRRVISSVCAFGGNITSAPKRTDDTPKQEKSIFRVKDATESKSKYEESLSSRYYENESRISWEVEENPPVELVAASSVQHTSITKGSPSSTKRKSPSPSNGESTPSKKSKLLLLVDDRCATTPGSGDQQKMRYRCKLCGQPKQNHICPYQQSLQRTIGIMVYPAVNSYTALEPGKLAPALTEMNNFVQGIELFDAENTPSRPSPVRNIMTKPFTGHLPYPARSNPRQVTPDSIRGSQSRGSPDSVQSKKNSHLPHTPYGRHPHYNPFPVSGPVVGKPNIDRIRRRGVLSPETTRRAGSNKSQSDVLFLEKSDLRPEQYRTVSVTNKSSEAYKFPSLPLPYGQRKVLSGNLFSLSKEVPQLADECASVLREARKQDKWDLAVAELLTQIMVVVYCPEGDIALDGLSKYLLGLGFAC